MVILSSYIFWLLISTIVVVLAIIGYLAEGTEFGNKALRKNEDDDKVTKSDPGVVPMDSPVEVLKVKEASSAWTGDVPKVDDKMETVHNETSVDDWMNVPNAGELPKVDKENEQVTMDNSEEVSKDSEEMFPDIKPDDLEPELNLSGNTDESDDSVWK